MSRVFWTRNEGFKSFVQGTTNVPDPLIIDEKMKSAFSEFNNFNDGVIQFWAPIKTPQGRLVLTSSETANKEKEEDEEEEEKYKKYKVTSRIYRYSIINDDVEYEQRGNKKEHTVLPNSPAASAFLNCFPEVVLDSLNAFPDMCLVLRYVMMVDCDLTCFFMLPVFYRSFCVGVVECCMEKVDGRFFSTFKHLKQALKSVGLGTFGVEECQLYKTISGLGHATLEVEQALEIVCEAHDLAVAQVWIPYENQYRVTSLAGTGTVTKQMLAVKLTGSCVDSDDHLLSPITNYYNICEMLPLGLPDDGLVGSALQTNEPHFCKNLYELPITHNNKKKPLRNMSSLTKCSCFVICLRSIHTRDLDYAFEFLWPRSRNHFILLDSLLLTLKSCLPNFKLASGEQLGDMLRVVDVENSTGCGNGFFKILEANNISPTLKAAFEAEDCISSSGVKCNTPPTPLPQECTRQHYGRPANHNAENLTGWQPTNFVKRKLSEVYESESDSSDDSPNQDILTINAEYADDVFKINLPISLASLSVVKEEINKRCKLNPGTCKLKYLDEDEEWILMTSDAHLRRCISCWRSVGGTHIRLCVLPLT